MELLALSGWFWELLGRLHPLLVHFPIGILVIAFGMELWALRKSTTPPLSWIWIGTLSAFLSATAGMLLYQFGAYGGDTVVYHQYGGWLTAILAFMAAWAYQISRVPRPVALSLLGLSVACLTYTGHLGAGLTHGPTYLTEVLPFNRPESPEVMNEKLAHFVAFSEQDSFPQDQLDQLNLEVRAIFAHNCYQCHSTEKQKGGLVLDEKAGVFAGGDSGPILIPGNARQSEIIRRLRLPRHEEEAMPPKGKVLPESEIQLVSLWIDQGAPWTDAALKVFPEAKMALNQPPLPQTSPEISHPIDKFVDQYFSKNQQAWPSTVADRRFIRRVYLDVLGLLPNTQQIENFVADPSPGKREHLVDRLLARNHAYAQHALSFWNDLLRNDYSGTGYITGGRKQISSWLYQSLLENKPYDQMLRELVNPGPESEGFIKGIRWRGAVNSSQTTEMQAAQNISQSLLGINMKCASCHNSFVNNLTLDQSYAFANVFADTTLEIHRCDKPTGRMASTAFLYPELGPLEGEDLESRLEQLAKLMSTPANGRVYRTLVNRYWAQLFGRGLVGSVDDMDQKPWSQELLDWLAADFIASGYDIKHLLRRVLTSKTYALESKAYPSPAYLTSHTFEFGGPTPRRMSAEQFVDALSQVATPAYISVAFDPSQHQSEATWIWYPEIEVDRHVLPKPGDRYFRKLFTLPNLTDLKSAMALISVDEAFTLYLNGVEVAKGSSWKEIQRLDLKSYLQNGVNVIAIHGTNGGSIPNPAGVLFELALEQPNGKFEYLVTDETWKTTQVVPDKDWLTDSYREDSNWIAPRRYGHFSRSHWGIPLAFRHEPLPKETMPFARASLVQLDPFMKALGRPTRENVTTYRPDESTLLQTLTLTNDAAFHEVLVEGGKRWYQKYPDKPQTLVQTLYQTALGRSPSSAEQETAIETLGNSYTAENVSDLLWSVVLLPEFQIIF